MKTSTKIIIFFLGLIFSLAVAQTIMQGKMSLWLGIYITVSFITSMILYAAISNKKD